MGVKRLVDYGYTLMELITASALIIVIAAAVAVPSYTRYIAQTKEKVCIANRQTLLYEYRLNCIDEPEKTLSEYLRINYTDELDSLCLCGGIYTAAGLGEEAELTCSIHRNETKSSVAEPEVAEYQEPYTALH